MHWLKGAYFWFMAFWVTTFWFAIATLCHVFARLTGRRDGRAVHRVASLWGRTIIRLMPGWRVTTEGLEHLPPDGKPIVVIANHESMSAIWAMYYIGLQFRWLAKESVFKVPMVGTAMRWSGYVPIKRGDRESAASALRAGRNRIRQGLCMFFFPEGTRSLDGVIKPFKPGAFKLAQDEQVGILPIAIHGAMNLLPKHSWIPGKALVKVRVLPALPPPAKSEDLDAYAERARQQIVAAHATLV